MAISSWLRHGSLGSCTMKLNSVSELTPVSWSEFMIVPQNQVAGYLEMIETLNATLAEITGFSAVSTQPNSGAQGEYAGLLVIRNYQRSMGQGHRNVCLIPVSAHCTNPASAVMAGMKVVVVKSDDNGNIDRMDLEDKGKKHAHESRRSQAEQSKDTPTLDATSPADQIVHASDSSRLICWAFRPLRAVRSVRSSADAVASRDSSNMCF